LAHFTIVVCGESSKKRTPKFSIGSKDDACTTNKDKESEELDHLEKHQVELVGIATIRSKKPDSFNSLFFSHPPSFPAAKTEVVIGKSDLAWIR
jgi:hypothetical protein